jgi:hypothetical protein
MSTWRVLTPRNGDDLAPAGWTILGFAPIPGPLSFLRHVRAGRS